MRKGLFMTRNDIMFTGKIKCYKVILAMSGILYVIMTIKLHSGIGFPVLFQLVPTVTVGDKFVTNIYKHKYVTINNDDLRKKSAWRLDTKMIIIIAYMRTGSTLTSSLFQEHPGTFFVFEPIRSLLAMFREAKKEKKVKTILHYIHGQERNYTFSQMSQVVLDEVNNWLRCRLESISKENLGDEFHRWYTHVMKLFYDCSHYVASPSNSSTMHTKLNRPLRLYYKDLEKVETCLKKAVSSCLKSKYRVLKFIRLRMKEIETLVHLYPNMKVIHLVRDPRAILNSRINANVVNPDIFERNIETHCHILNEDLKYSKRILQYYPNRLRVVRYEDIAEHPMETAGSILDFAELQFTNEMQDYLWTQTHSSSDSCVYCTQRQDSNVTASKWRTQLDSTFANYIYKKCKLSNSVLGYLPLSSVDALRNTNIASMQHFDPNTELLLNENF